MSELASEPLAQRGSPSRRVVLRAALVTPLALAACTDDPPAPLPPDPLAALAASARADAGFASAVAAAVPDLAGPAAVIAAGRDEHATALQREVDRERPPVSSTVSSSPAPASVDPATARTALLDALTAAEQAAGSLIVSVPRYRAGLLGSVAAGCASLREVLG